MSKKLLSFLLIACMLSSNMAVPASYAQTVNDGTANQNLETAQDSSANSDENIDKQGKEKEISPVNKVENDDVQVAKEDENQKAANEQDVAQENQGEKSTPVAENQENSPMVTIVDEATPLSVVNGVLAQDTATIVNQLGNQQGNDVTPTLDNTKIDSFLEVTDVAVGLTGEAPDVQKTLKIIMNNDADFKYYDIMQKLTYVSLDDKKIPLRDEKDGGPTFVLMAKGAVGEYMCFYNTFTGKNAIEDFNSRSEHKIVMKLSDGSIVKYQTDDYEIPDGRQDTVTNGEGEVKPAPTGNAAEYEIDRVFIKKSYGDPDLKIAFKKGDINKLRTLVKSVKVNGTEFDGSMFYISRVDDTLMTSEVDVTKKAKEKEPISIEIIFTDGSVLSNQAAPAPKPSDRSRVVNGYILTKDKTKTSYVDKILTRKINVDATERSMGKGLFKAYEVKLVFKDLVIGSETYKVKNVKYLAMNNFADTTKLGEQSFGFDIPEVAVLPETSPDDLDVDIIVEFDKTPKGYENSNKTLTLKLDWNNNFKQPEEEKISGIADGYSITGTKLSGERFTINLNKAMPEEQLKAIKDVVINGTEYDSDSYPFETEGTTIYIEEDEEEGDIIPKVKVEGITTLDIVFKDGSKISYEKAVTPPIGEELAKKYELKSHKIDNSNNLILSLKQDLLPEQIDLIKAVKVNGKEFARKDYGFYADSDTFKVVTANREVVKQVEDNKYDLVIEIIFADNSVTKYQHKAEKPVGGFADKFNLTNAKLVKTDYSKNVILTFGTKMTFNDAKEVKTIKINDKVFEKGASEFYPTRDGELKSENEEVINQFIQNQYDLKIEVTFSDGTVTKFAKTTPKPEPKLAEKYKLTKAEYEKTQASKKFVLTFEGNIGAEDVAKIEALKINGKEFGKEDLKFVSTGKVETQKEEILAEVEKNKDDLKLEVKFNDSSVTKIDTKIEIAEDTGLTLESNLPNGEYTLTYKAYVDGKNRAEASTLSGYFDTRVKLTVSENKKTVSFLNHLYADLILDFALQNGQTYVPFTKNVVETSTNGAIKKAEYTVELNDLTGGKIAAVLGSGPMGGNNSDIGQYDAGKYKKVEIVFDNAVTKGWSDYKVIEDAKKQKEKNDEILTEALIDNGLDTNKDNKISVEELRNAKGRSKPKSIGIDGFPMENVIDLEGKGITDISILKDLGPAIKGINLNGNKIEELPKGVFDNATGVTHLVLGANNIKTIDKDVLKPLKKLKYIDFDGNPLVRVPEGLFDENEKLTILSLMNTALESVPDNLIKNNVALSELYLQENKIKTLPDNFFETNRKLSRLTISSSQLENLPSSLGVNKPYLSLIQANNNNITSIPASFADLKSITEIELSNNRISQVDDEFFVNMIKYSKNKDIRLKLGSNNIKYLPVDKMIAALDEGKEIKYFQIGMNMLPMDISSEEKAKLKRLGVSFDSEIFSYYPQRTAIKATATADKGKVKLEQNLDILELFFWETSDIVNREKKMFTTEGEFVNYLLTEGRFNNGVSSSLPRDEAIAKILANKGIQWKVNTVITKENNLVYNTSKENEKEGQVQEFSLANLQKGQEYTITKSLYVYVPAWAMWEREAEYSVNFIAQEENDKFEEVKVKLNQENLNTESIANKTLKPVANLEKVGNKFRYTIFFKPMTMGGISGEIGKFFIKKDGQLQEVPVKAENGEYNKSFTFELEQKVEKLPVAFEIAQMGGRQVGADLVFEYSNAPTPKPPVNKDEKTVKGYILSADGKSVSMADQSLDKEVKYKKIDKKAGPFNLVLFTVKFNEMTIGQQTAGVDGLYVKLKNQWMEAKQVEGQKGVFTFEMLENAVREGSNVDTVLDIKFKVGQHSGPEREAKLLLDWNSDFNGTNANPQPQPNPGTEKQVFDVNVALKIAGQDKDSMANKGLEDKAKVEYKDGVYKYTLTFKPMEVFGQVGKITKFAIMNNGVRQDLELVDNGVNKTVTFQLNDRVTRLNAFVLADIMTKMGMNEQSVDVVFDWSNAPKPVSPSNIQIDATVRKENGVAVARVDVQETIVNIEKLANLGTLTIKVNADANEPLQVALPSEVLEKASQKENVSIELVTPTSKITLSKEVLTKLAKENDVRISIKKADLTSATQKIKDIVGTRPAIDVEILCDNKNVNLYHNVKVAIPYVKNIGEDASKIKAYHIVDNNNYQIVNSSYYDVVKNELVFFTNHFSVFATGYDNTTATPSTPSTGGGGGGGGGGGSSSSELRDGIHTINVWLRKAGSKNELSMASKALSKTAKVVKSGNNYTYTINFVPMDFNGLKGNVSKLYIDNNGRKTQVNGSDGEYTFSLDEKLNVLKVYVYVDILGEEKEAEIVFDWNGTNPAPAESTKVETKLKAQAVLVSDETKPSILNAALNPNVRLIQEGNKYQYIVEFKNLVQGNKSEEIESLGLRVSDTETTPVKGISINDSQYTRSFTFVFDKKQDKIKVSFKFDNITTDEKEAYIIFKDAKTQKTQNKAAAKTVSLKDMVEKVLSKAEAKYYTKETLAAIKKAYEEYNKGDKKAEAKLNTLLETARVEKITYNLEQGYMAGYDGNVFKPNANISIAEAAVMFAPLIDQEVGEIKNPTIKTKHWYTDSVNKMVALSYIKVKEGEELDPNKAITRAQYAYIVAKLRNYPASETNLSDIDKDYWARDQISSLVAKGVINGYQDKTFKPENTITRAEAVTIVSRAFPTKADISKKKKFEDVSEKHWAYKYIMAARKN